MNEDIESMDTSNDPDPSVESDLNKAKLSECFISCLEKVLVKEMERAFGENWLNVVFIKPMDSSPFWTLKELFKIYSKHWTAVFSLLDGFGQNTKSEFRDIENFFGKSQRVIDLMRPIQKTEISTKIMNVLAVLSTRLDEGLDGIKV